MKLLFRGLGPKESITYQGCILKNGATVDMDDNHAQAYIDAGIAFPVNSEKEVQAAQNLERKNAGTRERIRKKAVEAEGKGGEK